MINIKAGCDDNFRQDRQTQVTLSHQGLIFGNVQKPGNCFYNKDPTLFCMI